MKKKIGLQFDLEDPVYKFKVGVLYGGTSNQFLDAMDQLTGGTTERHSGYTLGCFFSSPSQNVYVLWLPLRFSLSTLGHEIIHLLFTMFDRVGVPTALSNQETFAYHWGWWFEEIRNTIKNR